MSEEKQPLLPPQPLSVSEPTSPRVGRSRVRFLGQGPTASGNSSVGHSISAHSNLNRLNSINASEPQPAYEAHLYSAPAPTSARRPVSPHAGPAGAGSAGKKRVTVSLPAGSTAAADSDSDGTDNDTPTGNLSDDDAPQLPHSLARRQSTQRKKALYEPGPRRFLAYCTIGLRAARYPVILLAAYLAIGGIYIVIAFRHEPFYERLATLLLVSSYDWFDPLIIVYQFVGLILLYCIIYSLVERGFLETTDPVRLSTTLSGMARRHLVIMGYGNLGRRVVNWALEQGRPFVVVEQNAERAARLLGRHCVVIGDVTESVTLELAGVRHASKILCTVHSSKTALLVAHRLQLFGVADKSMIRCFEDRISRAVQARGAQVFSTSEWLVHDLYKAFPNRKDECILILGVNKLGQRVATYCAQSEYPFIAVDRDRTALTRLYRRLSSATYYPASTIVNSATTSAAHADHVLRAGMRTVESTATFGHGITIHETDAFRLVKGDVSNEGVLERAIGNRCVTRAFVFIATLEDAVSAVEIVQRRTQSNRRTRIFVHVVDDGVEEMFEDMGRLSRGQPSRVETFSSSSHSFSRLLPFLEAEAPIKLDHHHHRPTVAVPRYSVAVAPGIQDNDADDEAGATSPPRPMYHARVRVPAMSPPRHMHAATSSTS